MKQVLLILGVLALTAKRYGVLLLPLLAVGCAGGNWDQAMQAANRNFAASAMGADPALAAAYGSGSVNDEQLQRGIENQRSQVVMVQHRINPLQLQMIQGQQQLQNFTNNLNRGY